MMSRRYGTPYTLKKQALEELPPYDASKTYTPKQLEAYADLMLRDDTSSNKEGPRILFQEQYEQRIRPREVNSESGTVDDGITAAQSKDGQTMYWRTHPEGRRVNSSKQRDTNGASYYR